MKKLEKLLRKKAFVVIAIDGACASGKTTLATELQKNYHATIIPIDDFFLPKNQEMKNDVFFDYQRFEEEVLKNLQLHKTLTYQQFNCASQTYIERQVTLANLVIIEGSYSLYPPLTKYYDLKIFKEIDMVMQLKRLTLRESKENLKHFIETYIPLENNYFSKYKIKNCADIIIKD